MQDEEMLSRARTLSLLMIVYAAASLLHFVHNALYIRAYPNMPRWLTPLGVYTAWCGVSVVGALGYGLYRKISQITGLLVITVYALLGFGGLDHYVLAPVGAHTVAMNATILSEVMAASVLLVFVANCLLPRRGEVANR